MDRVVIKAGRERSVIRRHPWVYSGAIVGDERAPQFDSSREVEVVSAKGEILGRGYYSPHSQIRVRMISNRTIEDLVGSAIGRRAEFLADSYTNAMRLINAESDLMPGVVIDYYAGYVVCQLTSAFADAKRREIVAAIMKYMPNCLGVSERRDIESRAKEGLDTEPKFVHLEGSEPPEEIEIIEGEVKFLVDVRNGHKTGFYLDQREARAIVGKLANGRETLNCFSYTGGFGLFARLGGATKVCQVDISGDALKLAKKNEHLTHICGTEMEYVEADVFTYLRKCRDEGKKFDMIILDPPKFASVRSQVMKAARGYKDINLLAMKLLRPDGILATFSCSGAMTSELFDKVVAEAAEDAGRDFEIIKRTQAGADHPVALAFPEGKYLKGIILRAI